MRRLLQGTMIIVLLALLGGCERSNFNLIGLEFYPIVSQSYTYWGELQMQEGVALAVEMRADLDVPELLLSLRSPDEQLLWERETTVLEHDQRLYVGSASFLLPPEFEVPTGNWKVEVIHPDGRALQHTFNLTKIRSAEQIPKLGFVDSQSIGFLPALVENREWTVELLNQHNQRLYQVSLLEGATFSSDSAPGAVKARYWRVDEGDGLLYRGETYLKADDQPLF